MFSERQEDRDLLAGVLAGAFGGLVFVAATFEGALPSHISSWGLGPAATIALRAQWGLVVGAIFSILFQYQPRAYAAAMSSGLLFGLLAWIAGPLTLAPILEARSPHWTLEEAVTAFPSLVAHLVYGGVTGLTFHLTAGRLRRGARSVVEKTRRAQSPKHARSRSGGRTDWTCAPSVDADIAEGVGRGGGARGLGWRFADPRYGVRFFCWVVTTRTLVPLFTSVNPV